MTLRLALVSLLFLLFALPSCKNEDEGDTSPTQEPTQSTVAPPSQISYTILNAYPHDTAAFTQGLELYQGVLYESTGLVGRSSLRKSALKTGRVSLLKAVDSPYFAEGITILNDTLYQLTWQNREVLVYRAKDLSLIKKLSWTAEGWGITNDGRFLYISDGTDRIYVVSPGDLKLQRVISVYDNTGAVNNLNELEYINGYIYANRWQYDHILRIDPASGRVTGRIDLTDILVKNSQTDLGYLTAPGGTGAQMGAVLNGIAWDAATGRLLVTGKLWPKVFELQIGQ